MTPVVLRLSGEVGSGATPPHPDLPWDLRGSITHRDSLTESVLHSQEPKRTSVGAGEVLVVYVLLITRKPHSTLCSVTYPAGKTMSTEAGEQTEINYGLTSSTSLYGYYGKYLGTTVIDEGSFTIKR